MDVFSSLSRKTKLAILSSTLFLLTLAFSVLMFGGEMEMDEGTLDHAREATRADMLYSHPDYSLNSSEEDQDVVIN